MIKEDEAIERAGLSADIVDAGFVAVERALKDRGATDEELARLSSVRFRLYSLIDEYYTL